MLSNDKTRRTRSNGGKDCLQVPTGASEYGSFAAGRPTLGIHRPISSSEISMTGTNPFITRTKKQATGSIQRPRQGYPPVNAIVRIFLLWNFLHQINLADSGCRAIFEVEGWKSRNRTRSARTRGKEPCLPPAAFTGCCQPEEVRLAVAALLPRIAYHRPAGTGQCNQLHLPPSPIDAVVAVVVTGCSLPLTLLPAPSSSFHSLFHLPPRCQPN